MADAIIVNFVRSNGKGPVVNVPVPVLPRVGDQVHFDDDDKDGCWRVINVIWRVPANAPAANRKATIEIVLADM